MNYKALKKLIKTTNQSENKYFFFALDRDLEKVCKGDAHMYAGSYAWRNVPRRFFRFAIM